MNANPSPCIVQFVGGPADGLVLSHPHFETEDSLQMPGCRASAYRLTCQSRTLDAGQPTTCLRYDFLGYEPKAPQCEQELSRSRSARRVAVRRWMSKLGRKFADVMLEPVDYPLKVTVESPDSTRHLPRNRAAGCRKA